MKSAFVFIPILLAALTGCQATPAPAPGMATLRLTIVAEPKTGAVTGNTHVLTYDSPAAGSNGTGQFEKVDYAALDDIVVWLEPGPEVPTTNPPQPSSAKVDVNPTKPADGISAVASVNGQIIFHNAGDKPLNLYSVSDGNDFDLGVVPAGGSAAYTVRSPGLIEVLTDTLKDPVAEVYAALSQWVRLTSAGQTVDFTPISPGEYAVVSWHPRLPGRKIAIDLAPNQTTTASIKVGVNNLPKVDGP